MKKAFFDLGPGVLHSEAWRKDLWKDYIIIGVEPDPTRYATLKDEFPGILLNLAVSDKLEKLSGILHKTSGFIAGGYPGYGESDTIEVECVTVDWLDEKYGPFDEISIWADIEGSEMKMLRGATNALKKTTWINVELHTGPKTKEWARSCDVFKFLGHQGFIPNKQEQPQTEHDSCYDVIFTRKAAIQTPSGYYVSARKNAIEDVPIDIHTFNPVSATTIVPVNVEIDGAARKYVGYASDVIGSKINLYYTDDLDKEWKPYSQNPILKSDDDRRCFRWPSVAFDKGVFHMFVDNYSACHLERWVSTDGIRFRFAEIVQTETRDGNYNSFIWLDPRSNSWHLYWRSWKEGFERELKVNVSADITQFGKTKSKTVLTEKAAMPSFSASPSVLYKNRTYFLLMEGLVEKCWKTFLFTSNSADTGFRRIKEILTENEACVMHYYNEDSSKIYVYISKLTGSKWTEEFRTAIIT